MKKSTSIFALLCTSVSAFTAPIRRSSFVTTQTSSYSSLNLAGFGGAGSSKKSGKKGKAKGPTTIKLKPKSQWDRYSKIKASSVNVAVRVAAKDGNAGEWYEVGKIKSEGDEFTEFAVVAQRAIIAEHAKRLHPLQFLPNDQVEWAYASNEDWITVDKSSASDAPPGIEKKIGFVGNPDKSGFYSRVAGKQFVGETRAAPLASGSNTLDQSVLPRTK